MTPSPVPLDAPPGDTSPFRAAAPVLSAITVVLVGLGLLGSALAVRAADEGFRTATVGLIGSGYYAGFLVGALVGPRLVARVGFIRVHAALSAVTAAATLTFPFVVMPGVWFGARFVIGLCASGMYVVAESWMNAVSTNAHRGRLLSLYLVVAYLAIGLGQVAFVVTDPATAAPFALAAAVCSLSVLPLALTSTPSPAVDPGQRRLPVRRVLAVAPLAPATSAVSGLGVGMVLGMGALYGAQAGMTDRQIGLFVALGMVGGIVLQWPIGSLSDRVPRRRVILATATVSGAVALVGAVGGPRSVWVFVAMFAFCACSFPLYSLAISHLNDLIEPEARTAAAGVLVLAYGVGSTVGPLLAAVALAVGFDAFWLTLAAAHFVLVPYVVRRLIVRPVRIPQRWRFRPVPAETAAPAILLDVAASELAGDGSADPPKIG